MANSFYEHSGYPPGSRARNSSQKLRAEFSAIEAGAQAIETALALKADAADVSEVDNTSDADKPISTLTQAALDLKADYSALVDFDPATAGADRMLVTNATGDGWEYPSITAAGKALLDDASAAAQRATLGLGNVANVDTTNASNISSGTLAVARLADYSRKNLLINGSFDVWQDGPGPFTTNVYTADGWELSIITGNCEVSQQSFTKLQSLAFSGAPKYFARISTALNAAVVYRQKLLNLAQFSGKTVTVSFDARNYSGTSVFTVHLYLYFGSGGSPSGGISIDPVVAPALTSSWVRHTATFIVPDLSSYTFGTTPDTDLLSLNFQEGELGGAVQLDIANVQLEFGDTATDFEYRHPAEELMLCQRYYEKGVLRGPFARYSTDFAVGPQVSFLVEKRKAPLVTLGELSAIGHDGTPGALYNANETTRSINPVYNWTGGTVGRSFFGQVDWTADARL